MGLAEEVNVHFPHIVGFEDVTHHKPHPEGLGRLMAGMGATPDWTLVVGDSWSDVGENISTLQVFALIVVATIRLYIANRKHPPNGTVV